MTLIEEKLGKLEEELKLTPRNKATESHVQWLKSRIAELRKELKKTKSKKPRGVKGIKKTADASVVLVGKDTERSELLERLTGNSERRGVAGTMRYKGANIQILCPSKEQEKNMSYGSDLIIASSEIINNPIERIKEDIFNSLGLIRVYTKKPGKRPDTNEPMIMKKGADVGEVCLKLFRASYKDFKYARIWGRSAKFPEQRVGLNHKLEDEDIVELNFKK